MGSLSDLIGTVVHVIIEKEENNGVVRFIKVVGTVLDVHVTDFYFHNKQEPIYITVDIMPLGEWPENIDSDDVTDIPLEHILKGE